MVIDVLERKTEKKVCWPPLNRATKLKAIKNRNMLLFYLIYFYYCWTAAEVEGQQRDRGIPRTQPVEV